MLLCLSVSSIQSKWKIQPVDDSKLEFPEQVGLITSFGFLKNNKIQ